MGAAADSICILAQEILTQNPAEAELCAMQISVFKHPIPEVYQTTCKKSSILVHNDRTHYPTRLSNHAIMRFSPSLKVTFCS